MGSEKTTNPTSANGVNPHIWSLWKGDRLVCIISRKEDYKVLSEAVKDLSAKCLGTGGTMTNGTEDVLREVVKTCLSGILLQTRTGTDH